MSPAGVVLWAAGLLFGGSSAAGYAEPLRAVVVHVQGDVSVTEAAGGGDATIFRQVSRYMMIGEDDRIRVGSASHAALICSTDRLIELPAGSDHALTDALCVRGYPVGDGDYAAMADLTGEVRSVSRVLVLERRPRGAGTLRGVPLLLAPRNTAVIESRPDLVWTQVPGAERYLVRITGGVEWELVVEPRQCGPETSTCTVSWPGSEELPPDTAVEVQLSVRGAGGLLRSEPVTPWIQRLAESQALRVRRAIEAIARLKLDATSEALLSAELYSSHKLYLDAISVSRRALEPSGTAEVRLALANAYLLVGLLDQAEESFFAATATELAPEMEARAFLGLGQIDWLRGRSKSARSRFREAVDLLRRIGMIEEAETAERWIQRAPF